MINERLATVEMPAGISRPKMGPVATGLGEVFHYVVTGQGTDVTDLRTIHDWVIKPPMRTVPGAAEINSWGGYEKQYQVRIDPDKLIKHDLTFNEVIEAVEQNNLNVGGGNIDQDSGMLLVQGLGRTVRPRCHCGRSSSPPTMACRFASTTWPRSPSATRFVAARSPPTARAKSCSGWASC